MLHFTCSSCILVKECIPVGCIPSTAVAVSRGGGCLLPGGCLLLGVSAPGGVCSGGVSALGVGGCLLGGVYSLGVSALGVSAPRGVSALGGLLGGGIPPCTEADTPSPCGQTDACKNIIFATSLRTVKMDRYILFGADRSTQ